MNTVRGIKTVIDRRGAGYLGYLLTGIAVPRLAYDCVWDPSAPRAIRAAFRRTAGRFSSFRYSGRAIAESAGPAEAMMNRLHRRGITGVRHLLHGKALLRRHRDRGAAFAAERDADRTCLQPPLRHVAVDRSVGPAPAARQRGARHQRLQGLCADRFRRRPHAWPLRHDRQRHRPLGGVQSSRRRAAGRRRARARSRLQQRLAAADDAARRRRRVVGIEGTPEIADLARANGRILAWRDIRSYDFTVMTGDMRLCLDGDCGGFDVMTAFCSLYYLPEADMARIIAAAARAGATLVLQANEAITNLPARAADLHR